MYMMRISFRVNVRSVVAMWWRKRAEPSPVRKSADRKGVNFFLDPLQHLLLFSILSVEEVWGGRRRPPLTALHLPLFLSKEAPNPPQPVTRPRENVVTSCAAETWRDITVVNTRRARNHLISRYVERNSCCWWTFIGRQVGVCVCNDRYLQVNVPHGILVLFLSYFSVICGRQQEIWPLLTIRCTTVKYMFAHKRETFSSQNVVFAVVISQLKQTYLRWRSDRRSITSRLSFLWLHCVSADIKRIFPAHLVCFWLP